MDIKRQKDEAKRYLKGAIFILILAMGILVIAFGFVKTTSNATYDQTMILFIEKTGENITTPILVPTGAGGKEIVIPEEERLSLGKEKIIISLKEGETVSEEIMIKNMENRSVKINLDLSRMNINARIRDYSFSLGAGESKTITIELSAENIKPGLYLGSIFVDNGFVKKEIFVIAEVQSASQALSFELEVPSRFSVISPGEFVDTKAIISITGEKANVNLKYYITNEKIAPILVAEENLEVINSINFEKKIKVPESLDEGDYVLYARATSGENVAVRSFEFEAARLPTPRNYLIEASAILIGIAAVTYIIFKFFVPRR